MTKSARWLVAISGAAALAAALFLSGVLAPDGERATDEAGREEGAPARAPRSSPPDALDGARPPSGSPEATGGPRTDGASPPAPAPSAAAFRETVAALVRAAANRASAPRGAEPGDRKARDAAKAAEDARDDEIGRLRATLVDAMRRDPGLADVLVAELQAAPDEAAVALARALRYAKAESVGTALARRAEGEPNPVQRRAAIVALEGRPFAVWFEPVSRAFATDPDGGVRDEAAGVIGRSLADPAYGADRARARAALTQALRDPDAAQRLRAVSAFLYDRDGREQDRDALRALTEDPDPAVARAAKQTLSVLSR